jgi:hypothetical protein
MNEYWEYWKSTRNFTLHLHIFEANLIPTPAAGKAENFEFYVVVHQKIDRQGTKQKTFPQKSLKPSWNQHLEFRDVNYKDELYLEIKRIGGKGAFHNEVIGAKDLEVRWLLDHLSSTEGNIHQLKQYQQLQEQQINAYKNNEKHMFDENGIPCKRASAFEVIGNKPSSSSHAVDKGGNVDSSGGGDYHTSAPPVNLPIVGAPIYPIEFKGEKYDGTILMGISTNPCIPVLSNDVMEGQTSNWNVATSGNFSCAVLP